MVRNLECVVSGVIAILLVMTRLACAEEQKPRAADRAAVAACLESVGKAQQHQTELANKADNDPPKTEKIDPEKWLREAPRRASADETSCIGVISSPCQKTREGQSTSGSSDCIRRELAVWDERLNVAYKQWIESCGDDKICAARKKLQRAWLTKRDTRCDLPSVEENGGTIAIPMTSYCLLDETARQAIWLDAHR